MEQIHGGDIYRNAVRLDFSVNINPLGIPPAVQNALQNALSCAEQYPDPDAVLLRKALSRKLAIPGENLVFGNGASELFMAVVHAIRPRKVLIVVPSFGGYEYAARAADSEIVFCALQKEEDFTIQEQLWEALNSDVNLLFLANPNNPTGKCIPKDRLQEILNFCRQKKIWVVLDECFAAFCDEEVSMVSQIAEYEQLILVNAFTKSYAIPGVRLGYLACSNCRFVEAVKRQLPEWNLSVFAQCAGVACIQEERYLAETAAYVRGERQYLMQELQKLGLRVFTSDANFLLFYSEDPLYEELLSRGILIRDCAHFRGLQEGYYRIAVRRHEENQELLREIGGCIERNRATVTGRN